MRGDRIDVPALVDQHLHAAELVERMERFAEVVFRIAVLFGRDGIIGILDDAGRGRILGEALLADQQFKRAIATAAGGHFEHAGLLAFAIENRSDIEALDEAATGDILRSSGIDTPAFTRRTLDWERISLSNGMSRDGLRVIFWGALAMVQSP